jgi:hypothetical protein
LSTSSSRNTGFIVPAFFIIWMILPGKRADVGAAVAADLGLVAHAAERQAHELAAGRRAIDLPSEVLPTPGGPTRQRIGPSAS